MSRFNARRNAIEAGTRAHIWPIQWTCRRRNVIHTQHAAVTDRCTRAGIMRAGMLLKPVLGRVCHVPLHTRSIQWRCRGRNVIHTQHARHISPHSTIIMNRILGKTFSSPDLFRNMLTSAESHKICHYLLACILTFLLTYLLTYFLTYFPTFLTY